MIVPETQRFMAERMKAKIKPHAVDHTPSVTAPAVVVDIIRDAIRAVAEQVRRTRRGRQIITDTNHQDHRVRMSDDTRQIPHCRCRRLQDFYREAGPADAPKLLLLHGFPSAGHMFRDLIPLLAGQISYRRARSSRLRPVRHAGAGQIQLHVRQHRRRDRALHRSDRLRSLRGLCLRLWRADRFSARRPPSRADHRDHLAERQRL